MLYAPDADDDLASNRALAEAITRDAFRRDPDRVVAVVREVIERLKAEHGYTAHELDAAARVLLEELSAETTEIPRRTRLDTTHIANFVSGDSGAN